MPCACWCRLKTREALKICRRFGEGVDGVFIGPADLSARDMGLAVIRSILRCRRPLKAPSSQIREAGKAPGILMATEQLAKRYLELGCCFTAGVDTTLPFAAQKRWQHGLPTQSPPQLINNKSVY